MDGLVQDCNISIANALEILQSCTKPLMGAMASEMEIHAATNSSPVTVLFWSFFSNLSVIISYSISQDICTRFLLCCALLWLYIDWFSDIHQFYFTGTVAI